MLRYDIISIGLLFAKKYGESEMKNMFFFASSLSSTPMSSTVILPESGLSIPETILKRVLFPAPFVPRSPNTICSPISTVMSSTALISSKDFEIFVICIMTFYSPPLSCILKYDLLFLSPQSPLLRLYHRSHPVY